MIVCIISNISNNDDNTNNDNNNNSMCIDMYIYIYIYIYIYEDPLELREGVRLPVLGRVVCCL